MIRKLTEEHNNMLHNKIYIIGSVASGKTTMAKKLSNQYNIEWYELDNVVHIRFPNGGTRRSPEERDSVFSGIINSEKWIIEGVYRECFNDGFDRADRIILLNTPPYKRKYRIAKRWFRQKFKLEKSNYIPTLKMLLSMYKWSKGFEKSKDNILKMLESYKDKVIIMNDNTDMVGI
ncbi:MAG: shikimate kinase family protein [Clostridiales bacterium]|jgi:adenylate kinase family enzyme|nr:shikimate kinase family protein [Clostridiales bacterium]